MDLRQLRYFTVLAQELHFRRAAERLNITQAPLSVAIQHLERELGASLFHRTQRRVELTELGAVFREHALAVLDRMERGVSEVKDIAAGQAGQLRIGFTSASTLLTFFPQMISTFRTRYPQVRVALRDLTSSGQILALQNREIDVGIVRSSGSHLPTDLTFTKLVRDPLVVAMHRDNALSGKASLSITDLRDVPLIFYPPRSGVGIYDPFMRACAKSGFTPTIVQEATEATTIISLAATGLGVAVVPAELQIIQLPNVMFRPLSDEDTMTDILLACRAGEPSPLLASFRHMALAAVAEWKEKPAAWSRPIADGASADTI